MDPVNVLWRKSSYSGGANNDNCVEVGLTGAAIIAVRDSKAPHSGLLAFDHQAWSAFTAAAGAFLMPRR
ncbi:DUF397 domain-containing protein [Amycolatopsis sp. CA-230715]|uniref:DUF397 domain-containing protein n=1 Tax=Amycolatopsis sp. CA-230715 TaxID=2745196 RepID=UPI001C02F610|nr:DUF397 domain-containing protein [Amycolatopsis sp. CA-230715]QWF84289.1 hypothetical protein HUW46_07739 [Amycolatopsis sp. CA-230715]